jgi:hypothetical protein
LSLTSELHDPRSPISRYLRTRFPHTRDLQRRYRQPVAEVVPLAPADGAAVAYATLGGAFDWRMRYLLTPSPDLHLAVVGTLQGSKRLWRLAGELVGALGGTVRLRLRAGPTDPDPPMTARIQGPAGLDEEPLARACYALALFTEVFRGGLRPGSRLLALPPKASLDDLLGLARKEEVADLLALTEAARGRLLPALAARGGPLHLGPTFAGSLEVGGADADVIAAGLLLEWKVNMGERRNGRRRCSLSLATIHQLLGYLLLDYEDAYRVEALGVYAARYGYLATWPVAELLGELAGGPVDPGQLRGEFHSIARVTAAHYRRHASPHDEQ